MLNVNTMADQPIPPMTWIGIIVAIAVVIGMSYFAVKAGDRPSKVREKQVYSDAEHNKRNR